MLVSLLICLLGLTRIGICTWPFDTTFLFWFWQTAVVVDQWLYIEGGEYYTLDADNNINSNPLASTLSIDLSQPWTVDSVSAQNYSKPSAMSLVRRPPVWYDPVSNQVMERGGWAYDEAGASFDLWSFSTDASGAVEWSLNGTASADAAQLTPTWGGSFMSSPTHFYNLGGLASDTSFPVEGLTTYDFATGNWSNSTSLKSSQSGYSVQGQGTFMPNFGQGLLAFLGGDSPPNQTYDYEGGVALVDMSDITIYDTASGTWYHQTATGSVPPPRSEFCVIGSAAQDNSSYEIYVFGGSTNATFDVSHADDTGYLDVFILSMPAFVWFKAAATTPARRANHFCQLIGQGQMLAIGGRDPSQNSSLSAAGFWDNVDPWTRGMNIFNMNSLNWTGAYSPSTTYDRATVVQQYYANHDNTTNWNDPALAALFTPTRNTRHSHTGAIVGGTVGGVGGLLIICGLLAFCLVRRRRSRRRRQQTASAAGGPGAAYEMPNDQKYEMETPAAEMPAANVERRDRGADRDKDVHTVHRTTSSGHAYVELPAGSPTEPREQSIRRKPVRD